MLQFCVLFHPNHWWRPTDGYLSPSQGHWPAWYKARWETIRHHGPAGGISQHIRDIKPLRQSSKYTSRKELSAKPGTLVLNIYKCVNLKKNVNKFPHYNYLLYKCEALSRLISVFRRCFLSVCHSKYRYPRHWLQCTVVQP